MSIAEADGTIRLSREELYERVWSEPMATLAPQFGISDVALKKTCTKMRVPTPYRGYWAKKSAGQVAKRSPLPKLPASVSPSTLAAEFGRTPKPSKTEVAEAVGPVADQIRYEATPEHHIAVHDILTTPHELVRTSVKLLRKAKGDSQHRLSVRGGRCLAASVTMNTVDRAMCIYDALIKGLEARGYALQITAEKRGEERPMMTTVIIGEERVNITIEERIDRVQQASDSRSTHSRSTFYGPQYDFIATGRLTLRILHDYLGVRRSWADGAKQRVEECLNDFIIGLVTAAEALRTRRLEAEARQREWLVAEERRQLAEQRRQEEAGRVRALNASMGAWRKSVVIREYVQAMRTAAEAAGLLAGDTPIARWLSWAEEYADRIDPLLPAPTVPVDPEPHRFQGYYNQASERESTEPRTFW